MPAMKDDTTLFDLQARYWGKVKHLGGGRLRGPVVLFGTPKKTDLMNEFFTKDTDFGVATQLPVYYQHGFDTVLGKKRLAVAAIGEADAKSDEAFGLWAEYQLDLSDKYQGFLAEMAEKGMMGHSSGALAHLVETQEMPNKSRWIKSWPYGELSLTPEPAEPRMVGKVLPLKTFQTESLFDTVGGKTTRSERLVIPVQIDLTTHVNQPQPARTVMHDHLKTLIAQFQAASTVEGKKSLRTALLAMIQGDEPDELKADLEAVRSWQAPSGDGAATALPAPPALDLSPLNTAIQTISQAVTQQGQAIADMQKAFQAPTRGPVGGPKQIPGAPVYIRHPGDSEATALAHWIRTGEAVHLPDAYKHFDTSPHAGWDGQANGTKMAGGVQSVIALKASNDTSYASSDAPGSVTVPTGHFAGIIARRDPGMITQRLGVRPIPGSGLTVNVPCDDEADGEFVSTAERAQNDRDAANLVTRAMTLVKYTKMVELTDEIQQDEGSALIAFLNDFVGRGMAKTHNNLLLTAVNNSGTSFKTLAATNAVAAGEPEDVVQDDDLAAYLDDSGSVGWVMRNSVHWSIKSITGNDRLYDEQTAGSAGQTLLGYPVVVSNKAQALGADNFVLYFGNWNFVGVRLEPEFRILRDELSGARNGLFRLHYYFRTVYRVLQTEAIGYAKTAA